MHESDSSIATVADLVEHLRKIDPEAELAFFDEGGAWCEVYSMPSSFLGSMALCEASEQKAEDAKSMPEDQLQAAYAKVSDGDVLVI